MKTKITVFNVLVAALIIPNIQERKKYHKRSNFESKPESLVTGKILKQ